MHISPSTISSRAVSSRAAAVVLTSAVLLAVPSAAQAGSSDAALPVTATVLSSAVVTATPLAFGSYNAIGSVANTATSSVVVTATTGTPYVVGINKGTGAGATVASRKLTSGTDTLAYSVYRDAAHTNVWGTTAGTDTVAGTGTGLAQTLTAYGQVPAGQNVPSGTYTDTLTVTVTY